MNKNDIVEILELQDFAEKQLSELIEFLRPFVEKIVFGLENRKLPGWRVSSIQIEKDDIIINWSEYFRQNEYNESLRFPIKWMFIHDNEFTTELKKLMAKTKEEKEKIKRRQIDYEIKELERQLKFKKKKLL